MKTSRAAVLTQYEAPLELKEFPLPQIIEPGAALVKVKLAGICGTDVHLWHGQLPIPLTDSLTIGPARHSRSAIGLVGARPSTVTSVITAAPNRNPLAV
jgi:hypothetical protein